MMSAWRIVNPLAERPWLLPRASPALKSADGLSAHTWECTRTAETGARIPATETSGLLSHFS